MVIAMLDWLAVVAAWISGFGFAALTDALSGFSEWDHYSVALLTFLWVLFGMLSIAATVIA